MKPSKLHRISDLQYSVILDEHVETVERKNSLLTGRNLQQNQAQCERPSATTDWGFERTEALKEHRSTDSGVLSIGKKSETLIVITPLGLVASSRTEKQLTRSDVASRKRNKQRENIKLKAEITAYNTTLESSMRMLQKE
ncbi:hypothetical protein ATANTOWER_031429 [Ataeniobius toweri]|uniref:BZIP domain-containing protein n=1 Tax=Ataeniobius toweri TaxID=208326 RepID=A0ABU7C445_9TELE|nr:hypothetical protein [Ataeniobius toweri]